MMAGSRAGRLRPRRPPPCSRARPLIARLLGPPDDIVRMFVHDAVAGVAVIDRHGVIVQVNQALRQMIHSSADLSLRQPIESLFCQQTRHQIRGKLTAALAGVRTSRTIVGTLDGDSGKTGRSVDVSIVLVVEADASITGAILHFTDVTIQRQLAAQLAQFQTLQAVWQLASGIIHDFNNLLTAVLEAADDALARKLPDRETMEDLEQIRYKRRTRRGTCPAAISIRPPTSVGVASGRG